MIMNSRISEWQYPLYEESDKRAYRILSRIGKTRRYPKLVGTKKEINSLLKIIVASQKMKDYRKFRDAVIYKLGKNEFDAVQLIHEKITIPKGIDASWAVFMQDKRICLLIDNFNDANISFSGSRSQKCEFIARFLLSQMLQDWRGPLMAVMLECIGKKNVSIQKLNKLLDRWDYTNIF